MANFEPKITDQLVADWVTTAFEGGINYWCSDARYIDESLRDMIAEDIDYPVYGSARFWGEGGRMKLWVEDEEQWFIIDKEKLIKALYLDCVSDAVGHRLIDACEFDADDADILIQAAIFGEIVYG